MKINKLLSLLLVVTVMFSVIYIPQIASAATEPEKTVNFVLDNFEDGDLSDYHFRNTTHTDKQSATVVEENGNKFLRINFNGSYPFYNAAESAEPMVYAKEFSDGKFAVDTLNYTVIEMKMRTNAKNVRKYVRFNAPTSNQPSGNGYNDYAWNRRVLWYLHDNGAFTAINSNYTGTNYAQGAGFDIINPYSTDTWYTVRMVIKNSSKTADYYVYNEEGTQLAKFENKPLSAWWFTHDDANKTVAKPFNSIENITFQYRNNKGSAVTLNNEALDIDDLMIANQKAVVNTSLVSAESVEDFCKPTRVSVKFDAPINYVNGGIKVLNSENNEVAHIGSYDETTLTYTATFSPYLVGGDYKFDISGVTPKNLTGNKISSMSFDKTQIAFTTYEIDPPTVTNLTLSGKNILGQNLVANAVFSPEIAETLSVYEWYKSSTGEDNSWTKIDGAETKELPITSALTESYIKVEVTPKSDMLTGVKKVSNIICPERVPVVSNLEIISSALYVGNTLTADYDFYDENGDDEGESVISWYTAQTATSEEWTKVGTGNTYTLKDADYGKYIKFGVIPVALSEVNSTDNVEQKSEAVGPVSTIIEATNLFSNPGLESGVLGNWKVTSSGEEGYRGIEVVQGDAYEGNYALRLYPRLNNTLDKWSQSVTLESGKRYILSAMVKKVDSSIADISNFEGYNWTGDADRPFRDAEYTTIKSATEWTRTTLTLIPSKNQAYNLSFVSFSNANHEVLLDNLYVGPVMACDVELNNFGEITIPDNEPLKVQIVKGLLNQFGENKGLTDQTVSLSVDARGVRADGNSIVVSKDAVAGVIPVTVNYTPTYAGEGFTKVVNVTLLPGNNRKPVVEDIVVTGDFAAGNTLTANYSYHQVEGKADVSSLQWVYKDTVNGQYHPIENANSLTYVIDSAYQDKYIAIMVTPKAEGGEVSEAVYSVPVTKPRAPYAENVKITGDFKLGETVTADYKFVDDNLNSENGSTYKWYISDTELGTYTELTGKTDKTLTFDDDSYVGKFIKFSVTPITDVEPKTGVETFSDVYFGPTAPSALNVTISQNGTTLTGSYDYYHPYNVAETNTEFTWTVNGSVVSREIDYVINYTGMQTVVFSVTPVGDTNPARGQTVSVTLQVGGLPAYSGGTGVSGGGISGGYSPSVGGGAISGGIVNINDMTLTPDNEEQTGEPTLPSSDIDSHWGKSYIKEMEKRGVMEADSEGNFDPDKNVSREVMLTFLFKALKLETTDYNNEFEDIKDGEFAKMLQTMVDNGTIAKDTSFRPGDTISREEMCKILYISLKNQGKLTDPEEMLIEQFADYNNIAEWARPYVNGVYANKIMVGVSDAEFDAKGTVTKAQAATMLVRILNLMEGEVK